MGGSLTPFFLCANLLVRVKLGYPPNFNFLGKPLLGEKYVHGKKKETIMPSHYVYPLRETVRAHALRSHQNQLSYHFDYGLALYKNIHLPCVMVAIDQGEIKHVHKES